MSRFWLMSLTVLLTCVAGCGGKSEPVESPSAALPPAAPAPPPAAPAPEAAPTPMPMPMPAPEAAAAAPADPGMPAPAAAPVTSPVKQMTEKKEPAAPVIPPREADPQLVEKIRQAAASSGPADVVQSMKKIGQAFSEYARTHDNRFPAIDGAVSTTPSETSPPTPGSSTSREVKPRAGLSWRVAILPQLGLDDLYREFHLDESWDSEHNKSLLGKMPAVYGTSSSGRTRLHLIRGRETPFQTGNGPALEDFTDGLSNTLTVVQAGEDKEEEWTRPAGLPFDQAQAKECLGDVGESFLALTADGTLHRIPTDTDLLSSLICHQDRQVVPSQFLKETLKIDASSSDRLNAADLPPLSEKSKAFNPEFIPESATTLLVISPRRIVESKLAQAFLKQFAVEEETPMQALDRLESQAPDGALIPLAATEEIRIFPDSNLTQTAIAAASASPDAKNEILPPGVSGIYFRTSVSLPLETVIRKAAAKAEKVDVQVQNGIPHVWLEGLTYSLAFPSDREMLIANRETLLRMTSPPKAASSSQELVEAIQSQHNPMIAFAAEAPAGGKLAFMQQLMSSAGPVGLLAPQLNDASSLRLSVDLEGEDLLKLSLGFPQEDTAKTFLEVARTLLTQGVTQGKMLQASLKETDPAQKAQSELLGDVLNGSAVSQEGSLVSLAVKQPAHLENLIPAFQSQIQALQKNSIPEEALPPLERISKALVAYQEEHGHLPASNGMGDSENGTKPARGEKNLTSPPVAESGFNPPPPGTNLPGRAGQKPSAEEKIDAAIARNRGLSWRVYLLPFLGEQALYEQFHLNERWDSPHNKALISQMPAVFGTDPDGKTRIQLVVGSETLFKSGKSPELDSLRDDPATTIVAVETGAEKADFWTKPGGLPFDPKNPTRCLGKADDGQTTFQTIMLDWSVQSIPVTISADEFRALVQPSDGKPNRKNP